jgi:RecG-like helicase
VVSAVNLNDKNESLNRPSDDIPVEATSDQATAMTNVEDCWLRLSTGAILGGPIHSGKTVVACSLLWKFRLDGPQLILCSPSSVVSARSFRLFRSRFRCTVVPTNRCVFRFGGCTSLVDLMGWF